MSSGGWDLSEVLATSPVPVRELASGVDALYLSGRAALRPALVERLEAGRLLAGDQRDPVAIDLGGEAFRIASHGFGKHRFCLDHRHGQLGVSPGGKLPAFRIQPRAEYLHGVGPARAVDWFRKTLSKEVGPVRLSASRLDLHCDVQGWMPDGDERRNFVCRAQALVTRESDGSFTGFEFGRRATKTISARLYDKTAELNGEPGYWQEVWGPKFDRTQPVLRVEFEFGRQGLKDFGLDTPEEVLDATGALWASATDWLSYRVPTSDQTRSRWPVAREWEVVRRAAVRGEAIGLERARRSQEDADLFTLVLQASGYLASIAARIGTTDATDTCERLPGLLTGVGARVGRSFEDRIAEKAQARAFQ